MIIFKLFLDLFKFMLFCFTHRKRLKQVLFMLFKVVNILLRKLEQHNLRPAFLPHEKFLIAALFEGTEHAERFFNLVTPNTILSAWKNIFSKLWAQKKHKPGRPPITKAIKELILKMKNENRLWGSRRIRDELLKLSVKVSHETISKTIQHFMKENVIKPTLAWKKFISSNLKTLFACDFFTVDIFGFKRFYAFFIIQLETRKIVQFSCTDHPNMLFVRNQLSCFSEQFPNVHLIHDNSGELKHFPYQQYGIKGVATVPYSPNMNAYAERFVRSIRQECLDYFIIFTYGQLYRIIKSYVDYYNNYRPHQGIKGIPNSPSDPVSKTGTIKQKPLVFGLHNHYYREAV